MNHLRLLWILILLMCVALCAAGQQVNIVSYDHVLRWADESRFPNYTADQTIRGMMFSDLMDACTEQLKAQPGGQPSSVGYRNIMMFGKAKFNKPRFDERSNDYQIAVLSFLTRATTGFAIEYELEIRIYQGKKTILEKRVHHELAYFSSTGYFTSNPWFDGNEFAGLVNDLTREALGLSPALPQKIIIGSVASTAAIVHEWLPDAKRIMMKTDGDWKGGTRFLMAMQGEGDTLVTARYREGMESGRPIMSLSGVAAKAILENTGIDLSYRTKSNVVRHGQVTSSAGQLIQLRMEWVETTEQNASATVIIKKESPMVAEWYRGEELLGTLTYYRTLLPGTQQGTPVLGKWVHTAIGTLRGAPVRIEFDESTSLVVIGDDQDRKAALVMINVNPEGQEYNNMKLSKNKKIMVSANVGSVSAEKASEWYYLYYNPGLSPDALKVYLESLVCFFAGVGH